MHHSLPIQTHQHASSSQSLVLESPLRTTTADQPFLPPNITREVLERPIPSLIYLRQYIPVITPGSAAPLIYPLLTTLISGQQEKQSINPATVEIGKKPPLNAFMLFRMTQSMHLTYSPSGRAQNGQKIISKLISVYWRLLSTSERDEWYELADDLKMLRELNRRDEPLAMVKCKDVSAKFAGRPYIPPSAQCLAQIDGKIGPRNRLPSSGSRSAMNKQLLDQFLPFMQARIHHQITTLQVDNEPVPVSQRLPHNPDPHTIYNSDSTLLLAEPLGHPRSARLPPISSILSRGEIDR